ncbi:hypothetical protein ABCR94_33160 [Streptomyces sp. 21So2-11]|uniref:hypothetical protein n=1 Tax=Streptomyces sp. 21So2-11 TaxID=3144408 RepID=UPI003219C489
MISIVVWAGSRWLIVAFPLFMVILMFRAWPGRPWYRGLSERKRKGLSRLPLIAYGLLLGLMLLGAAMAVQTDGSQAALNLMVTWVMHSIYASGFEPEEFALERMRGRLSRAVHLRVFALWCGITGVAWLAWWAMSGGDARYRIFLSGATLTIALGGIAASLKVYTRFRKLCTALNRQSQRLLRSLEELWNASSDEERLKLGQAARRSWDDLHELLVTKVDTGFDIPGVFVLPEDAIEELKQAVMAAIDAAPGEEAVLQRAANRLFVIQAACRGRVDAMT